jgi:hypothetical protein
MDRLLDKGILVTHYEVAGLSVIVVNTHIIANYAADYGRARAGRPALRQQSQLRQLADDIKALPADALVMLVGDFNLPRGSWLYEEFLEESGMEDTLKDDHRPTYSNLCLDQPVRLVGNYHNFLSDHLGIISNFSWDEQQTAHNGTPAAS